MAEFDVTTGHDTYVVELSPTTPQAAGARFPRVRSGNEYRTLLHMPIARSRIAGQTILSATLSGVAQGNWVSQTLTVQAVSANWTPGVTTWDTKPAVTGATATEATGALAAAERFEVDITALIQAIADGQAHYGWQITTNQSTDISTMRGFGSGLPSWTLHVEVSDAPPTPTQLAPVGVIGTDKPTVLFDDTDDLAEVQVMVDATPAFVTPDFDTGWVAVTTPQLDLSDAIPRSVAVTTTNASATISFAANAIETADIGATITGAGIPGGTTIIARPTSTTATMSANATASASITATVTRLYAGLADGATTNWTCRVKTIDGSVSDWAQWQEITRDAKPTLIMDNPSGTDLWDPTPTIEAHLSPAGDTDTRWQVIITEVNDLTNVRYNSGDAITGAALAHEVPLRWKGRKVLPSDRNYRLLVKAWDRMDRAPSPGDPPFIREIVTVTLDVDGTVTAPSSLTATQVGSGYPDVRLQWERASDPDRFVIRRNGEVIARVDPDDVRISPGVFRWEDESAEPNVDHSYTVRAVTDVAGVMTQSDNSNTATITTEVTGTWLRWDDGDVLLFTEGGAPPEAVQVDQRQTFILPYRSEPVDIVTSVGGFVCDRFSATIDDRDGDLATARTLIDDLREAPHTKVRVIWGTRNVWANLRGLSRAPHKDSLKTHEIDAVEFGFFEIDTPDT